MIQAGVMKEYLKYVLAVVIMMLIHIAPVQCGPTWYLKNARFDDGGLASGFFTIGDRVIRPRLSTSVTFDIKVSGGDTATFPPWEYTCCEGFLFHDQLTHKQHVSIETYGGRRLSLDPTPELGTDGTVSFSGLEQSYECFVCGGPRRSFRGQLTTMPVPTPPQNLVRWDLHGITFTDGATASGFFVMDNRGVPTPGHPANLLVDFDIVISGSPDSAGFHYTPTVVNFKSTWVTDRLAISTTDRQFQLEFSRDITDAGGIVSVLDSFESKHGGGKGGEVITIPEPSVALLLALGFATLPLGLWARRATHDY
jgi:hypothetical protein